MIPQLAPRIELLIVTIFLPIYFASSGMKTQLALLDTPRIWGMTVGVIALASVSKVSAVTLSAKIVLSIRKERIKGMLQAFDNEDYTDSDESERESDSESDGACEETQTGPEQRARFIAGNGQYVAPVLPSVEVASATPHPHP